MKNLDKNCRICVEWQEHYYWNHMADDKKHFFKPMVGDFTETMVRKKASQASLACASFSPSVIECVTGIDFSGLFWACMLVYAKEYCCLHLCCIAVQKISAFASQ